MFYVHTALHTLQFLGFMPKLHKVLICFEYIHGKTCFWNIVRVLEETSMPENVSISWYWILEKESSKACNMPVLFIFWDKDISFGKTPES